jgi:prephenate dehydrogenase
MTIQITIIGTGQIGASVGMALAEQTKQLTRVGHDKEYSIAQKAKSLGAFDQININLPSSVEKADIVFLALPIGEIRETLKIIALDLKPDSVVMDTAPVKSVVAKWMKELLPAHSYYVGLTPVINAAHLTASETGVDAARADLFKDGAIAVCAPPGTPGDAIKLGSDLARLLGATPFFADIDEVDGLMASVHILPQLVSAALAHATIDQPGWREGRKLAGRAFTLTTSGLTSQDAPETLAASALLGRDNVLRSIDRTIAALGAIRDQIANDQHESLKTHLNEIYDGRMKWWSARQKGDWLKDEYGKIEAPHLSDVLGHFVGFRRKDKDKDKQP